MSKRKRDEIDSPNEVTKLDSIQTSNPASNSISVSNNNDSINITNDSNTRTQGLSNKSISKTTKPKAPIPNLLTEKQISRMPDQAIRIKLSRLRAKLLQSHTQILSALKLSSAFERQKLGRRQKQASEAHDGRKLGRLREEVILLRGFDLSEEAGRYLVRILERRKAVREHAVWSVAFGKRVVEKESVKKSSVEMDVLARLWKSGPVVQVVPGVVTGILNVLGLEEDEGGRTKRKDMGKDVVSGDSEIMLVVENEECQDKPELGEDDDPINESSEQNSGVELDENIKNDIEIDEETMDAMDARLAGSSEESDVESDISNASDIDDDQNPMDITPPGSDEEDSESEQEDEEGSSLSLDTEVHPRPSTLTKSKSGDVQQSKPTTSAFLPSLNMMTGYFSGGSDSENEDDSYKDAANIPQPRKNRRGQRERQKIAEMKYGSKANHLQKQQAQQQKKQGSRNTGWDARRGAVSTDSAGRGYKGTRYQNRGPAHKNPRNSATTATGSNGDRLGPGKQKDKSVEKNTALHPSWEAARKRKSEGQGQMAAFSGKKITFD